MTRDPDFPQRRQTAPETGLTALPRSARTTRPRATRLAMHYPAVCDAVLDTLEWCYSTVVTPEQGS
jgi:hypothetical protein